MARGGPRGEPMRRSLLALLCCAALALPRAWAQSTAPAGVISGTIIDSLGVPAAGVWVIAIAPDRSMAARVVSDSAGRFQFAPLAPADYVLVATGPGFRMIDDPRVSLTTAGVPALQIRVVRTSIPHLAPNLPPPPMDNDSGGRASSDDDDLTLQRSGGGGGATIRAPRAGIRGGDGGRSASGRSDGGRTRSSGTRTVRT